MYICVYISNGMFLVKDKKEKRGGEKGKAVTLAFLEGITKTFTGKQALS